MIYYKRNSEGAEASDGASPVDRETDFSALPDPKPPTAFDILYSEKQYGHPSTSEK